MDTFPNRSFLAHDGTSDSPWAAEGLDTPFGEEEAVTLPSRRSTHETCVAPKRPWALVRKRRPRVRPVDLLSHY